MGPRRLVSAIVVLLVSIAISESIGIKGFGVPTPRNVAHAASGTLTPFVPNGNLASASFETGTPPTNYDFETGDLTGWTSTGTVTVNTFGPTGDYASFSGASPTLTSSAFTLASDAQTLSYDYGHAGATSACLGAFILSGPTYSTSTTLTSSDCTSTAGWVTRSYNVTQWGGQSIKIKFQGTGTNQSLLDNVAIGRDILPHWDVSGSVTWVPVLMTDGPDGNYGRVINGTNPTSEAFTVPSNATTLKYSRRVATSGNNNLRIRCAPNYDYCSDGVHAFYSYLTLNDNASPGSWVEKEVDISNFRGQTVKLEFGNAGTFDWYIGQLLDDASPSASGVSIASGSSSYSSTDLSIPGKGIPLEFTRFYSSASASAQATEFAKLGYGWTHSYAMRLTFPTSALVTVFLPQGSNETFKLTNNIYGPPPGSYDSLVKNGDNSYTLTTKAQIQYNFSSAGKLNSIVDRNGNTTSLTYDGTSGLLSTVTDPGGRTLSFTYTSGRLTEIEDPLSRTVSFSYNSSGDLTSATDVNGNDTTYAYSNRRMTSFADPLTHQHFSTIHDTYNRVVEKSDGNGGVDCYYYGSGPTYTSSNCPGVTPSAAAGQTIHVDANGKKTVYDFDATFRPTQLTDHGGNVATLSYDSNYNVTCVTDPLGHKTAYAYDSKGNVTTVIDANNTNSSCTLASGGVQTSITYTSLNDVETITDALGNKTHYVYDSNGNVTEVQRKDSSNNIKLRTCLTVPTSGTNKGLVTEVIQSTSLTDCTGNTTKVEYDSYGDVTGVVDPRFSGQGTPPKTTATYDDGGRMLTLTNELSHTTTITYDNQNRVLTSTDNLGDEVTYTYDANGNLKTVTDPNRKVVGTAESGSSCGSAGTGNGTDDDTDGTIDDGCPNAVYSYDNLDRVVSVVDAMGKTTSYSYDSNGNLKSVTNAKRQVAGTAESGSACGTAGTGNGTDDDSDGTVDDGCPSSIYAYDNQNRLSSETDALGHTWSYTYDAAGRVSTRTDPKSQVVTLGYNNRGDVTSIDYPSGTSDVTFQYDAVRKRTQMADGTGTTSYSYDAVNRLTSVTFPTSRTVGYTYSNAGNRATVTHLGTNTVTYGYDAANNLTSVTDWNSNQTTYAYDNAGRLTTATLPSGTGIVGSFSYDNADRLTGVSWVKGGSTTVASASYTLDAGGNRTQRVDQAGTHSYSYDALYRLTQVSYPDPATDSFTYDAVGNRLSKNTTSYTYDAADRLTSVGSTTYTYDNNGNMTARGNDSFSWDAADRLTSATVGGTTTTFAYNGDGLRDSFTTGGVTTTSTWDIAGGLPQELYDGTLSYVYGIGRLSQVDSSGNTYYYLPDALGSVMTLVDSSGAVADSYNYDVFGAVRSSSGSQANPFTYTGERTDVSTGLEYLRARYYDPAAGSFISRDSVATPNRYAYANGNPVVFTDPSGLCVSQATHDKFMAAKNPFRAGEVRDWYQHIMEMWQNQPVCEKSSASAPISVGTGCSYPSGRMPGQAEVADDPNLTPEERRTTGYCLKEYFDCTAFTGKLDRENYGRLTQRQINDICYWLLRMCQNGERRDDYWREADRRFRERSRGPKLRDLIKDVIPLIPFMLG